MHLVIVGNGVAGIEAAREARRRDPAARITLISEESDHFFSRTALVWVLAGQMKYRDIEPYERDLYIREGFERVRGRVVQLHAERHQLEILGQEAPLTYDRLLLALGSRPRRPPWAQTNLRGVGHFVSLQDLAWLEEEIHGSNLADCSAPVAREEVHPLGAATHDSGQTLDFSPYRRAPSLYVQRGPPKQPCVIGGGLIGLELVEVLRQMDCTPTLLVREKRLWPAALHLPEATWMAERLQQEGISVHFDQEVQQIEGDTEQKVQNVQTTQDKFPCDLCVIAVGVVPNTAWLNGLGITRKIDGAICVDEQMRTELPDVYAAGDCAAVAGLGGQHQVETSWYAARAQGRIAGANLTGRSEAYRDAIGYNAAKIMDIEYTSVGALSAAREAETDWFFEERGRIRSMTRLCHYNGALNGFHALGRRWDTEYIERWVRERAPLHWVTRNLAEASFDSEGVPPLRVPAENHFNLE